MYRLTALLLLPWLAAAQLTPNSVTVTASRDLTAQADQVQFGITINSGTDATLDDVVAVARGAGLTQANFTGVNYSSFSSGIQPVTGVGTLLVPRPPVAWSFVTATAISDMKSTIGLLTALQTNLAKDGKYALSFNVNGTQVSPKAQQALTCPISDLLAD